MGQFKKAATRKSESKFYMRINQIDRPVCDCCRVRVADWMDRRTGLWLCTPCKEA